MTPEVSVFLDLVRFGAAMIVFIGHVAGARFTGGFLWQASPYMGMAVALFFVLSGVVIGFVTLARETDWRTYTINRLARIYSVALPAILLTLGLDTIGRHVSPALYSSDWGYDLSRPGLQIATALTFTQRLFGADLSIGSNLPYWSLNYEVVYYVIFGVFAYARGVWLKAVVLAGLALAAGDPILALFPLWLAGFVFMRLRPWTRLPRSAGWMLVAGGLAIMAIYEAVSWHWGRPLAAMGPAARPEIAQDYLIAGCFLIVLTGVSAVSSDFVGLARRIGPAVKWAAGRTFSLYLYHLPVAQFLAAVNPLPHSRPFSIAFVYIGTLSAVAALAQVTEQRKADWRRLFVGLIPKNTLPAR